MRDIRFYRKHYDILCRLLLTLISTIFILTLIVITLIIKRPDNKHYASSNQGLLTHLIPIQLRH
jgi:hypothetical protein